jgi:hypothetical protein
MPLLESGYTNPHELDFGQLQPVWRCGKLWFDSGEAPEESSFRKNEELPKVDGF